jgi:spore coat polysaccharide biosynthesis protein SpsF
MQKSLVVVQCRYNSTRLVGKALYPICGIPMLVFLLKRLKDSLSSDDYNVILATTENQEDDIIAAWGKECDTNVIRGEAKDVFNRFIRCLNRYPSDYVVRVTADNPLTCPEILKESVNEIRRSKSDYLRSENHPVGTGVDVFTSRLLKEMEQENLSQYEREHINAFVLKHPLHFKIQSLRMHGNIGRPDLSVTVDTEQDWKKVNSIIKHYKKESWRISIAETISRMDSAFNSTN